ncbi:hypothetical protein WA026_005575 [Henosepilachna vigintioctopunctata]|uniref:Serpin domain-containing protein n=1 Tax=Henosepilachna vigintioctopunctata TaxID=420089 RepID=A0AAW1U1D9_9CUCU
MFFFVNTVGYIWGHIGLLVHSNQLTKSEQNVAMKLLLLFLLVVLHHSNSEEHSHDYSVSNRHLAKNVYTELAKKSPDNLIFSPLSLQLILTLTRFGAKGHTEEELQKGLGLSSDLGVVKQSVKDLLANLTGNKPYTVVTANKVYIKEGYPVKSSFKDIAKNIFLADIENVDFSKKEEAAEKINKYVEEKTENLIKNLIKAEQLDKLTRMLLINTLYFKANWSHQFDEDETSIQKFSKSPTESLKVSLMRHVNFYRYGEIPELDAKVLQVPYKGNEVFLTIILPNKVDGLAHIQQNLEKALEPRDLKIHQVELQFPKFKMESDVKLKPLLKNLGIKDLFDDSKADLSGIAPPEPRLYAKDVFQKVYIKFTESGTTAATATAIILGVPMSSHPPVPTPFIVDHPFFFYISKDNFVFFAGHVTKPEI